MKQQSSHFSSQQYSKKQYWDSRYQKKLYFDWYVEYPELKQTIQQIYQIQKSSKILMVGCGNSLLSQQMYDAGYLNITNIDISDVVIHQMKDSLDSKNKIMQWIVMDATDMKFQNQTFDCIIDKGTLDALISGKNFTITSKILRQMTRVMKKSGNMIIITYSQPQGRRRIFQDALDFNIFEFFFVKVPLSNQSVMINLMRSSCKDKPLNKILQDKQAFTRAMLKYNLIRLRNKQKKLQRFKIQWNQIKHPQKLNQNIQQNTEQILTEAEQQKNQQIRQKIKKQLANQSQTHCYAYYIQYNAMYNLHNIQFKVPKRLSENESASKVLEEISLPQKIFKHHIKQELIQINPQIEEYIVFKTKYIEPLLEVINYLFNRFIQIPRIIIDYSNNNNEVGEDNKQKKIGGIHYEIKNQLKNQINLIHISKSYLEFTLQINKNSSNLGFGSNLFSLFSQLQQNIKRFHHKLPYHYSPYIYNLLFQYSKVHQLKLQSLLDQFQKATLYMKSSNHEADRIICCFIVTIPPNIQFQTAQKIILQNVNNENLKIIKEIKGLQDICDLDFDKYFEEQDIKISRQFKQYHQLTVQQNEKVIEISSDNCHKILAEIILYYKNLILK